MCNLAFRPVFIENFYPPTGLVHVWNSVYIIIYKIK